MSKARIEQIIPSMVGILITNSAYNKMQALVQGCKTEIGWFGVVRYDKELDANVCSDIVVPPQTVTATETDMGPSDLASIMDELEERGIDPSELLLWGHSHVNMGITPSKTDHDTADQLLEDMPELYMLIMNKQGLYRLDYFDRDANLVYREIEFNTEPLDLGGWDVEEQLKRCKTAPKPTVNYANNGTWHSKFPNTNKPRQPINQQHAPGNSLSRRDAGQYGSGWGDDYYDDLDKAFGGR